MPNSARLIKISEAAKLLNCHPNTLRNWDKEGILKPVRIGGKIRKYKRDDILRLINRKNEIEFQNNNILKTYRNSGIKVIGDIPWGTHFCQFYQTKQDLLDILTPYFKTGLENNEYCMWVTSEPLRVREAKKALEKIVPHLEEYFRKGQIEILDYRRWYIRDGKFRNEEVLNGWLGKYELALKNGFSGMRLTGNTFWLEKKDWKDFTSYETLVNDVIAKYKMIAICTYSTEKCGINEVVDVMVNHKFALLKRGSQWSIIESSEQKKMEERLRRSEEFTERLSLSASACIYEIDFRTQKFIAVNDAMCRLSGYSRNELLDMDVSDLLDEKGKILLAERTRKWLSGEKPDENVEYKIKAKDGHEIYALLNVSFKSDKNGLPIGATVIGQDITNRKKTEETLQLQRQIFETAIQNLPAGVALYRGPDFIIEFVNPSYLKISSGRGKVVGKKYKDVWPEAFPRVKGLLNHVLKTGDTYQSVDEEFTLRSAGGKSETRYFTWSLIRIPLPGEEEWGILNTVIETTERLRAVSALSESEKKFSAMFHKAGFAAALSALPDGNYVDVNDAWVKMFGYTKKEAIGKTSPDLNIGLDFEKRKEALKEVGERGFVRDQEMQMRVKSGNTRTFIVNIDVLEMSGKKYMLNTVQDITRRKNAEEKLRDSEMLLKLTQRIAKIGSWEFDLETNKIEWSDEVYRIFEIDKSNFGASYEAFLEMIHPDDRKLVDEAYTDSLKTKKPYNIVHRLKLHGGKMKYVREICETYFNKDGKPVKSVGSVQDITDQVKTESELKRLATFPELNPNPIIEVSLEGKVAYANPATKALFPDLYELSSSHPFIKGIDFTALKKSYKLFIREIYIFERWYMQSITYVPEVDSIRIYSVDITERKELEQQKDEFLNIASHELKTPLTSIKAFAQILKKRSDDNKSINFFATQIDNNTNKLSSLVNDLMDVGKIGAGKLKIRIRQIDIESLVIKVINDFKMTSDSHAIIKKGKINKQIFGDADRLEQVLVNLISNAIKYSPGSDKVKINLKEQKGNIVVSVQDFGIGIPAEKIPFIFERYYRARDDHAGFGLGLFISREIIKQHNGRIWLNSTEGKGSTFYFSIPAI